MRHLTWLLICLKITVKRWQTHLSHNRPLVEASSSRGPLSALSQKRPTLLRPFFYVVSSAAHRSLTWTVLLRDCRDAGFSRGRPAIQMQLYLEHCSGKDEDVANQATLKRHMDTMKTLHKIRQVSHNWRLA